MELLSRFREEYRARFGQDVDGFVKDLGFELVRFRLSLNGTEETLELRGPGYSPIQAGYRRAEIVLKELAQNNNIGWEVLERVW